MNTLGPIHSKWDTLIPKCRQFVLPCDHRHRRSSNYPPRWIHLGPPPGV